MLVKPDLQGWVVTNERVIGRVEEADSDGECSELRTARSDRSDRRAVICGLIFDRDEVDMLQIGMFVKVI